MVTQLARRCGQEGRCSTCTRPHRPVTVVNRLIPTDNNSAISVARNSEHFGRLKHLDLRFYWLRDIVQAGLIDPQFCPTAQMPADMLTKALPRPKVAEMRTLLGLQD